jgi:hypothetical protein
MVEIQDNFLSRPELEFLQNCFSQVPWKVSRCVSVKDRMCKSIENFQLIHEFYSNYKPQTDNFDMLMPLLRRIKPSALIRVKSNLNPRTHEIVEHGFHIDHTAENGKTSIFYVNTNDGYTLFENGDKIESIENRFITFDSSLRHSSSTCTDSEARIVINFNYF